MALAALLCVVVVWQVAAGAAGPASTTGPSASPSAVAFALATPDPSAAVLQTDAASPSQTAPVVLSPSPSPSPSPTRPPTPAPKQTDRPWSADPAFVAAKNAGRVIVDSSGKVQILSAPPAAPSYPAAASLDTSWIRYVQEPARYGKDDKGVTYRDDNYAFLCGPATAAVILYYWPATHHTVTTLAGQFKEPVNVGRNRYASTYWKAQDAGGYGRGMMMYLAVVEWPAPDKGLSWWSHPGIMRWTSRPDTYVENLVDGINWEASGRSTLAYFYTIVHTSELTAAAMLDHIHADINMGVPVVIAARTTDGTNHLPYWNTSRRSNHFVTVVGYDDKAGTYAVMDTCGLTCNSRHVRSGLANMSQSALWALVKAEVDNDGIMW